MIRYSRFALALWLVAGLPHVLAAQPDTPEQEPTRETCLDAVAQARALAEGLPEQDASRLFAESYLHQALAEAGNGEYDDCVEQAERATDEVTHRRHVLRPGENSMESAFNADRRAVDMIRAGRTSAWPLIPIVAASGFAGLGYEVVWTRMLSLALGTEMMAVLGVVAGFFGGLALGAFLLDGPIRRARSPSTAYALLELVIGVWALISVGLLPWAGRALPPLIGTAPPSVLLWAVAFALPALALLPAAVAMGGTLTALERMVAARGHDRLSAAVYGGNTAGAVAGALAAVFLLLPWLGFSGTLLSLAALNLCCALGALAFRPGTAGPPETGTDAAWPVSPERLTATLFATGFLGVAFEVLVVRIAAEAMQDTIYTFTGLLAAYLLGTAAGSMLWQGIVRRFPAVTPDWPLAATAVFCLITAGLVPFLTGLAEATATHWLRGEIAIACLLFFLPSAGMGAAFGAFGQASRDRFGSLGRAVGINAVGAALAPIAVALVLIPASGPWTALLAVSVLYLTLLPLRRRSLALAAIPAAIAGALWLRPVPSMVAVPPGGALLATSQGPATTASVVSDASGARYLDINGHFRMGGTNSVRSDWRQAMLPLLLHPAPAKALFLGVGTGTTLAGAAHVPNVGITGVELLPEVADLLPWFAEPGAPPLAAMVTVADARRFVAADRATYDVIVADLFHPALDGTGALYTTEHFAAVKSRLAEGGIFCQWLPLFQLDQPSLRAIIRSFLDVYPDASAWIAHYSVRTPMLALVGGQTDARLDPARLAARLSDPRARDAFHRVGLDGPMDVLGLYLGSAAALRRFAGEGPRNTDDFPFVTLDAGANVRALTADPAVILTAVLRAHRPDAALLLPVDQVAAQRDRLAAFWRARDRFIKAGTALRGDPRGRALVDAAAPDLLDTIRISAEFNAAYEPLIQMALGLMGPDPEAGVRLLRAIDAAAPARPEARALLVRIGRP